MVVGQQLLESLLTDPRTICRGRLGRYVNAPPDDINDMPLATLLSAQIAEW